SVVAVHDAGYTENTALIERRYSDLAGICPHLTPLRRERKQMRRAVVSSSPIGRRLRRGSRSRDGKLSYSVDPRLKRSTKSITPCEKLLMFVTRSAPKSAKVICRDASTSMTLSRIRFIR